MKRAVPSEIAHSIDVWIGSLDRSIDRLIEQIDRQRHVHRTRRSGRRRGLAGKVPLLRAPASTPCRGRCALSSTPRERRISAASSANERLGQRRGAWVLGAEEGPSCGGAAPCRVRPRPLPRSVRGSDESFARVESNLNGRVSMCSSSEDARLAGDL